MAFHTGPLYHLKGRPENAENHNKLLDNPRGLRCDHPLMLPSLRSVCVQRCSEKSISFQALFRALELNKKIFSPHRQALRVRMWWPAVPPFMILNQSLRAYFKNYCQCAFPRKRSLSKAAWYSASVRIMPVLSSEAKDRCASIQATAESSRGSISRRARFVSAERSAVRRSYIDEADPELIVDADGTRLRVRMRLDSTAAANKENQSGCKQRGAATDDLDREEGRAGAIGRRHHG